MIYKINRIFKKTGVNKNGENYSKINIQTDQTGTDWLSGFQTPESEVWAVGDQVELTLKEREWEGKKFFDYAIVPQKPDAIKVLTPRIEKMEKQIMAIAEKLGMVTEPEKTEMEKLVDALPEINPDDIPF